MDADLKILEDKITQLIALTQSLAQDNLNLRGSLDTAKQEIVSMREKMQQASVRVEKLLAEIPEANS
jgi:cell division protein ZapB